MDTNLQLPIEISNKANKILLFDSLNLFGDECGKFYDETMSILDKDWFIKLKQKRNNFSLHLYDPDFVIKEPLNEDSPLLRILPSSKTFFQNLKFLKKLRNYVSHAKIDGETDQTLESIQVLFDVSIQLNLSVCQKNFAEAAERLKNLENGMKFTDGIDLGARTLNFELKSAELEEQLMLERNKLKLLENQYDEVLSENAEKRAEIDELKRAASLTNEELSELELDLNSNRVLAKKLEKELNDQNLKAEDIEKNSKELANLINKLSEVFNDSKHFDHSNSDSGVVKAHVVGDPWPFEKGKRKITLSIANRDLFDPKSGEVVDEIPVSKRQELAELWLKIRPTGGRIFIDGDGYACTLIGDEQIYLGNINY
jgi:hypothetical protein